MAHPARSDNVVKMLNDLDLPESIVSWADDPNGGAMSTARKAWQTPFPEGCTHRLVLQDDAELCDNFKEIAEIVASKHPDEIVTFCHEKEFDTDERYQPFELTMGVALMVPVKLLDDFWWFVEKRVPLFAGHFAEDVLKRDTSCMRMWLRYRHIPCITTVPTLVQHIGDVSLVGIDRLRVAPDFDKHPPLTGW